MTSLPELIYNGTLNTSLYNITIEELNREQVLIRIPSTILVIITMTLGVIGNSLTCYVYGFRLKMTPTYFFVVMLACADLIMCVIITPGRIVQNVYPMMTTWDAICKNHMVLSVFTGWCNCGFLLAIAVERYIKVCCPFKRQITMKAAKRTTFCIFFFCAVQGSIVVLYYGSIKRPTLYPGIYSNSCSAKNSKKPNYYQLGLFAFYLLVTIFTIIILAVLYSIILRRLKKLVTTNTVANFPSPVSENNSCQKVPCDVGRLNKIESNIESATIKSIEISTTDNISDTTSALQTSTSGVYSDDNTSQTTGATKKIIEKKISNQKREREINSIRRAREDSNRLQHTTVTMMIITVVFIIVYIPCLCAMMVNAVLKSEEKMSTAIAIFYWLARHSFYINSCVNPIIFGCRNQKFVGEIKRLFRIK